MAKDNGGKSAAKAKHKPADGVPAPVQAEAAIPAGSEGRDWSKTLFLPQTDFPMRAGLPDLEPRLLAALGGDEPLRAPAPEGRATAPSSCCTTARPTPTATSTSGMRSTRSSRISSSNRRACSASIPTTCRAGTATACRSSGRSRRTIAPRAATRTRCRSTSSAPSAASSPRIGSTCSARSSSASASSATGRIPTRRWTIRPRRSSPARS